MSKQPPERYKPVAELTVAEHLERIRTGAMPESDEFIAYRAQVLREAGIEPDAPPAKASEDMSAAELESLSVDEHLARMRRERS